jgi:hypothetical protein
MKKILLTLVAGFCFANLALAQEPAKVAKKKAAAKAALTVQNEDVAKKLRDKKAKSESTQQKVVANAQNTKSENVH